jgi:hypothetical protein
MTSTQQVGRPLSEAQRQHLTTLIAAMRVAAAKKEAAESIMAMQVEMAQKEFDSAQDAANAFLRYCGLEHQVTFDDGQWGFDEQLMCFVRKLPPEQRIDQAQLEKLDDFEPEPHLNGVAGG